MLLRVSCDANMVFWILHLLLLSLLIKCYYVIQHHVSMLVLDSFPPCHIGVERGATSTCEVLHVLMQLEEDIL